MKREFRAHPNPIALKLHAESTLAYGRDSLKLLSYGCQIDLEEEFHGILLPQISLSIFTTIRTTHKFNRKAFE